MNAHERHFVDLVLNDLTEAAQQAAGIALAARDRKHVLERGSVSDNSRWWINLSLLLASFGRNFIETATSAVTEISRSHEAYTELRQAVERFLTYLGAGYEKRYRSNRFFYSPRDHKTAPLPPYWADASISLERLVEIQRRHFIEPSPVEVPRTMDLTIVADTKPLPHKHPPQRKALSDKPGPKMPYLPTLHHIFKKHRSVMAHQSQAQMHEHVVHNWPEGVGRAPSKRTIAARWAEWRDEAQKAVEASKQ